MQACRKEENQTKALKISLDVLVLSIAAVILSTNPNTNRRFDTIAASQLTSG